VLTQRCEVKVEFWHVHNVALSRRDWQDNGTCANKDARMDLKVSGRSRILEDAVMWR